MKYAYYQIILPKKTYVARAHCISLLAYEFFEEFSFDEADDDEDKSREFLAFEPLRDRFTVKGVDAKIALDVTYAEYKKEVDYAYEEAKGELGEEEALQIMNEEYAYEDLEMTAIILEADNEED